MSTITLCCNFKDEEKNAEAVYNCVKSVINEWVVVDSGSTDSTIEICRTLGARVYQITHPMFVGGYGGMRTLTAHLARSKWVLILDGDERILPADVKKFGMMCESNHDLIWLPRQHYRAFDMSIVETRDGGLLTKPSAEEQIANLGSHPDWQPRFFRNLPNVGFERMVHERPSGFQNPLLHMGSPVIRHFGFLKTEARLKSIAGMCEELWQVDQQFKDTYINEAKVGHAMSSPHWQEWYKKKKSMKASEESEEYLKYWKVESE